MRRWFIRALLVLLTLAVIGAGAFVVTWSNPLPAHADAMQAMQSSTDVTVTDGPNQIVFMPHAPPRAGFIFYPGARVAPAAYAVSMHAIAEQGYAVFVPKLPLNMALLDINAASGIMAANPEIMIWAVGGHSLGGVAASMFAGSTSNPAVKGLILLGSYPSSSLASNTHLAVISIFGSRDGLSTPAKIADSKSLLPASTRYVVIEGGNHGQFGDYGPQDGDNTPDISAQQQTAQVVEASVALLEQISKP